MMKKIMSLFYGIQKQKSIYFNSIFPGKGNSIRNYFLVSLFFIPLLFFSFCTWADCTWAEKEINENEVVLNSNPSEVKTCVWQMKRVSEVTVKGDKISDNNFNSSDWDPAIIPGTALNSMVANGVFPEPYYGQNNKLSNKLIPDIANAGRDFYYFWYRTTFDVPENFSGKKIWLQFDGINYIAHIWLNGHKMGDIKGMFLQKKFEVSRWINPKGKNCLAVAVEPVKYPGTSHAGIKKSNTAPNENKNGGNGEIGKNITMLMSVGWDFTFPDGIRDRNTGIWRNVKLFTTGSVSLEDPFIKSSLPMPALSPSKEEIQVTLNNSSDRKQSVKLVAVISPSGIRIVKHIFLSPGEKKNIHLNSKEYKQLTIENPKLWWPVNKGPQNLYTLHLEAMVNGEIADQLTRHFGIRDIRSDQKTPDHSRIFYINGKRLFIRGSNWIPEAMLRTSKKRTYTELRYTRQAGINMLRLWGGGISESDDFFDICDQLGILVWHEFWLTGDTEFPADTAAYYNNVRSTVKRIRNHPSLSYYVASNERKEIPAIKPILMKLDGTRGYQDESECCGIHDGSPYKYENPMQYYDNSASERGSRIDGFCPEYGTVSLPTIESLRKMMPKEELWPIDNNTWKYLSGNGFFNMATKYNAAVKQYGTSCNIEDFAEKGQMVGAVAFRSLWECWNYNKFQYGDRFTSGVLFWFHNSPIPQVSTQMWDWYLEPTAALYFTKNALEPIHAQFDFIKNTVSVYNDFFREIKNIKVRFRLINMDMETLMDKRVKVNIPEDGVANDILKITFPENHLTPVHFLKLEVYNQKDSIIANTFYWRSTNSYKGPWTIGGPLQGGFESLSQLKTSDLNSQITSKDIGNRRYYTVRLSNKTSLLAFFNRLMLTDSKTGEIISPVFYSDNYFSMLPGESKIITIDVSLQDLHSHPSEIIIEGYNVKKKVLQ